MNDDNFDNDGALEIYNLGLQLMVLAGRMYEYGGYGYSRGERPKRAAKAWKTSAGASNLIFTHWLESDWLNQPAEFYRFQSAARIHRASYHWVIAREENFNKVLTKTGNSNSRR